MTKDIVTIDGPSASGKSSVSKLFAEKIARSHLDTGAIYRAITLYLLTEKIAPENNEAIELSIEKIKIDIEKEKIFLNEKEVTTEIRNQEVTQLVAVYAKSNLVREFARSIQMKIIEQGKYVVDGRDIGSVVFPQAFCKFYLDADLEERAKRRYKEMKEQNQEVDFEEIKQQIKTRDHEDGSRALSPLTVPEGAFVVNSSSKTIEEVLEIMLTYYEQKISEQNAKTNHQENKEKDLKTESKETLETSENNLKEDEDETSFAEAMEKVEEKSLPINSLQKATIVSVGLKEFILDLGIKKDARVLPQEMERLDLSTFKVGDEIDVIIKNSSQDGEHIDVSILELSDKKALEILNRAFASGESIEGLVKAEIKGGVTVDIEGFETFCPYSHLDVYRSNPKDFLNTKTFFKVLQLEKNNVLVSRKGHFEKIYEKNRNDFFETATINHILEAKVIMIKGHHCILEIMPGVTALLRIENVSWQRVENIASVLEKNQTIKVSIIGLDKEKNKIEVSLKATQEDPILSFAKKHQVGEILKGKIQNLESYGAFVSVEDNLEGLLHVSSLSWSRLYRHPKELLKKGDEVEVCILKIDVEQRRIALGMKELSEDPWNDIEKIFKVGELKEVIVDAASKNGLFCFVDDAFEGFLHRDNLSWNREQINFKKIYPTHTKLSTKIIGFNKINRKIQLGLKQTLENPWEQFAKNHPKNTILEGTVVKIIEQGCFVKLADGIEGFCHISQLSPKRIDKVNEVVEEGKLYSFMIQQLEPAKTKIQLSIRAIEESKEKHETQKYVGQKSKNTVTLKELLK